MTEVQELRNLINKLNNYTKLYDEGSPAISDKEWDDMYFSLVELEKKLNITYADSPTQKVHFETVSLLEKTKHEYKPMLSLDKTKNIKELERFCFKDPKYADWCAMFKLDGLSCRLTYIHGELIKAETRGNGIEGEDTHRKVQRRRMLCYQLFQCSL